MVCDNGLRPNSGREFAGLCTGWCSLSSPQRVDPASEFGIWPGSAASRRRQTRAGRGWPGGCSWCGTVCAWSARYGFQNRAFLEMMQTSNAHVLCAYKAFCSRLFCNLVRVRKTTGVCIRTMSKPSSITRQSSRAPGVHPIALRIGAGTVVRPLVKIVDWCVLTAFAAPGVSRIAAASPAIGLGWSQALVRDAAPSRSRHWTSKSTRC